MTLINLKTIKVRMLVITPKIKLAENDKIKIRTIKISVAAQGWLGFVDLQGSVL